MSTKNLDEFKKFIKQIKQDQANKMPIYRGCKNDVCFCTGKCREIIGCKDKPKQNERIQTH